MASKFSIEAVVSMIDRVSNPMGKASSAVGSFSTKTQAHFAKAERAAFGWRNALGVIGALGGVYALTNGIKYMVSEASKIEDARAAFTPLLGGAEQAAKLVDMLNIAAAETPYRFDTISGVAKQLLPVMNGDLTKTVDTFKMLGDTAGGNAEKLTSITRGFTKAMLKGKVDMESLNMIAEAGVPIFTEMATSMGYNKDQMTQFFKKISSGTVSTDELTKAFKKMTSEGGIFFQGMIIASKTTSGVFSTMQDSLAMTAAGIGDALLPVVKDIAMEITKAASSVLLWVQNNKEFLKVKIWEYWESLKAGIKIFIDLLPWIILITEAFIGFKAALVGIKFITYATQAFQYVNSLSKIADMMIISGSEGSKYILMLKQTALWQNAVAIATTAWSNAQKIINFLLFANPIGIVIIAVAALAYAIYDLYTNWDKYALQFNISIQNFVTGFARAKMEVYELLNAVGLISDKELTGAKLDFLQNFTTGVKLQTEQIRQNKGGGMASPVSNQIANGGGNSINGRVGIDINSNVPGTTMMQESLPSFLKPTLNTGLQP